MNDCTTLFSQARSSTRSSCNTLTVSRVPRVTSNQPSRIASSVQLQSNKVTTFTPAQCSVLGRVKKSRTSTEDCPINLCPSIASTPAPILNTVSVGFSEDADILSI